MQRNELLFLSLWLTIFSFPSSAQFFPNGDFENGTTAACHCPTNFTCNNDAGRVVDGIHPIYTVGNNGCVVGSTNYTNSQGAHGGTGYAYFYAGADRITSASATFSGGEEVCVCVWYTGPQGSGPSGQNTGNSYFRLAIDGAAISPNILVPTNTPWTQHCETVTMTAGTHNFGILSGGAAQYSLWFDDFSADLCVLLSNDLLEFEATEADGIVDIYWQADHELENDFYVLEKSTDGIQFNAVATIYATEDPQTRHHYQDEEPYIYTTYYRLRQTELNGKVAYSKVRAVNISKEETAIQLFPNPSYGNFKIDLPETIAQGRLLLINGLGQTVFEQSLEVGINQLDVSHLPAGMYSYLIYDDQTVVSKGKLLRK